MMQLWRLMAVAAALAIAGCDSGDVPNPADKRAPESQSAPLSDNAVELRADGVAAASESFYFAAGQTEVEAALVKALGPVQRSGENPECGAGPITFTDFAGGLTAHFQEGRLVGWNWHAPRDGDAESKGVIRLPGAVQVGSARSEVEAARGFAKVEASTLGEEFALGPKIGGFIAGDKVEMLYAGTQCFFR